MTKGEELSREERVMGRVGQRKGHREKLRYRRERERENKRTEE